MKVAKGARRRSATSSLTPKGGKGQSIGMTESETKAAAADVAALSFEAAMAELEGIVRRLESGDVSLEESVALYERGHSLRAHCEARLKAAQMRIEQVSLSADGQPSDTVPFGDD